MPYIKHILQSSSWADFRRVWGTKVVQLSRGQFTVHPLPFSKWTIGYMPRPLLSDIDWNELKRKAKENNCIFVKLEPNSSSFTSPENMHIRKGKQIFATATYHIDLKKSEEDLLKHMDIKTRYNINLAKRKGVEIRTGNSEEMIAEFLEIYHTTAKRHKILLHPDAYYKTLFEIYQNKNSAEILTAYYQGTPIASMMLLFDGDMAYYPYGGSTTEHREVKSFHLLMWEAIRMAKARGYQYFDMWNCLPPELESSSHPWYGFHYFKKGFSGELVTFCGAYDLILNPIFYFLYLGFESPRMKILRFTAGFKKFIPRRSTLSHLKKK